MKEATGELNLTVVTVVAIGAIAALLYIFVWPMIKARIVQQTCNMMGAGYTAERAESGSSCDTSKGCFAASQDDADEAYENGQNRPWCCCPATTTGTGSGGGTEG